MQIELNDFEKNLLINLLNKDSFSNMCCIDSYGAYKTINSNCLRLIKIYKTEQDLLKKLGVEV